MGYFAIPTAVFGFFFSSLLTMLFWNLVAPWVGLEGIGYINAMVITIALWLVVAPIAAAISRRTKAY
jgi:ABC-type phosphate transport system permease subunit